MKETILEKAEIAINELNQAALLMHRQMKSGELNKSIADKAIFRAQQKAKICSNAYFSRKYDPTLDREREEFNRLNMADEVTIANERFGRVLKHFAKAVGAEFIPAKSQTTAKTQ